MAGEMCPLTPAHAASIQEFTFTNEKVFIYRERESARERPAALVFSKSEFLNYPVWHQGISFLAHSGQH